MKRLVIMAMAITLCMPLVAQSFEAKKKLAEGGNMYAQYDVAYTYYNGTESVEKNPELAFYWCEKAAKQGVDRAYNLLGLMYQFGEGTKKDVYQAEYWFKKGVEIKDKYCIYSLGVLYTSGDGLPKYEEGINLLLELANKGDMYAMNELGNAYNDLGKNDLSLDWYLKAVEKGSRSAKANLGANYLKGTNGFPIDYEQSIKWSDRAAKEGDAVSKHNLPIAQYKLGEKLHEQGKYKDAIVYFMRAASNEDNPIPEAMRKLSAYFRYGLGDVTIDPVKEKKYMEDAAKYNDEIAMKILGR